MTAARFESLTADADVGFPEYDDPPAEPMALVAAWVAEAKRRDVREPLALALATADSQGRASSRIIAVISLAADGVVFASHSCSTKAREIDATGWASGLLYWRETGQQIVLSGPVVALPAAQCDEMWSARPIPLHAMSAVSRQSEPLHDVDSLRAAAHRLEELGTALPRPHRYAGYRLEPASVEFWCAAADRLHLRLRYDRTPDGWRTSRLQP